MTMRIPVFRFDDTPDRDTLLQAAARVIASRSYVLGSEVEAFERDFAAYCGATHAVGLANGTDALELAMRAVRVGAGSRVAMASNAGCYASSALGAIGGEPVFVDIDGDMTMSPQALAQVIDNVSAVVVTHLYGKLAAIEDIVSVAGAHGVPVIEDCAQAHGARRGGRSAGAFGSIGCFSFYPTKNLGAIGDGGAIVTADARLAERVRVLRQYGWTTRYRVDWPGGRNSRLDEIQAALLREKLPHLERHNERRRSIARRYGAALAGLPLALPQWRDDDYVAHLFVVRTPQRDALRALLETEGIATAVHYPIPDHLQPVRRGSDIVLPETERACREVLTLPCFPGLRDDEVDEVARAVRQFFES